MAQIVEIATKDSKGSELSIDTRMRALTVIGCQILTALGDVVARCGSCLFSEKSSPLFRGPLTLCRPLFRQLGFRHLCRSSRPVHSQLLAVAAKMPLAGRTNCIALTTLFSQNHTNLVEILHLC